MNFYSTLELSSIVDKVGQKMDGVVLKDSASNQPYTMVNPSGNYKFDEDAMRGFETSVQNNQTQLALVYAIRVIRELRDKIDSMGVTTQEAVTVASENPPEESKSAPRRKKVQQGEKAQEENAADAS